MKFKPLNNDLTKTLEYYLHYFVELQAIRHTDIHVISTSDVQS